MPTPATKMLASTMLEAARQDSPVDAVVAHLGSCRRGQEAALVAALLELAVGLTPERRLPVETVMDPADIRPEPVTLPSEQAALARWVTNAAARIYQVTPEQVLAPSNGRGGSTGRRGLKATQARHVVMYVLRVHGMSLARVAELVGRDHTTVRTVLSGIRDDDTKMKAARAILTAATYGKEQTA